MDVFLSYDYVFNIAELLILEDLHYFDRCAFY